MGLGLINAVGAVAGGAATGLEQGQDMAYRRERRARETDQYQRAKKLQDDMDAANAAASDYLKQQRTQYDQQGNTTLQGPPAEGETDVPHAPMAPWKPSNPQLLNAAKARTDYLFSKGRYDVAAPLWANDEKLRASMRGEASQRVRAALSGSGDLTTSLSDYYDLFDDGHHVTGVQATQGMDGKPVLAITRSNAKGDPTNDLVTPDELLTQMDYANANPDKAAEISLHSKARLGEIHAFGEEQRKTAEVRGEKTVEAAGVRAGASERNNERTNDTRERNNERTNDTREKVGSMRPGGGAGAKVGYQRTFADSEGFMVGVPKGGGPAERILLNGQPVRTMDWSKRVDKVTNDLSRSIEGAGKKPAELRQQAIDLIVGGGGGPKPAAGQPTTNKDFSGLWN